MFEHQMQDFCATLLIFLRCELAARAFVAIRELSRVNFISSQYMTQNKESIKPESSITSLLSDYKKIFTLLQNRDASKLNTINASLRSDWIYWVYNQTYLLCLKLFERFIRYLRKKEIDETGLYRLEVTLKQLQTVFNGFLSTAYKQMQED